MITQRKWFIVFINSMCSVCIPCQKISFVSPTMWEDIIYLRHGHFIDGVNLTYRWWTEILPRKYTLTLSGPTKYVSVSPSPPEVNSRRICKKSISNLLVIRVLKQNPWPLSIITRFFHFRDRNTSKERWTSLSSYSFCIKTLPSFVTHLLYSSFNLFLTTTPSQMLTFIL